MIGTLKERFCEKYTIEPNSGCWLWNAALGSNGYGLISDGGKLYRAHRASWVIHRGLIPNELWVLHRCDVKACVNPDHLFIGSAQDNVDDMVTKGRQKILRGEANGGSKLIARQVVDIRTATGFYHEIAARFGVHQSQVTRIKNGHTWGHL